MGQQRHRTPVRRVGAAAVVMVVMVAGVIAGCGSSEDSAEATKCSASGLDGSYGVRFDGASEKLGRFASVSIWKFDGKGKLTASETYNSERTGPQKRQIGGRYTVKGDCSFQLLFGSDLVKSHEADGSCVLMDRAKTFHCLDNEKGWVTVGTGTKI